MSFQKRQTPDKRFTSIDGTEIGLGEVKPFNASFDEIEKDRIRLGELSKKMLHRCVLNAKSRKELVIFAILSKGHEIEYFLHQYHPSSEQRYRFTCIKRSTLQTTLTTFTNMQVALENLPYFKTLVVESLPQQDDVILPYIFRDGLTKFKPTVSRIKLKTDDDDGE